MCICVCVCVCVCLKRQDFYPPKDCLRNYKYFLFIIYNKYYLYIYIYICIYIYILYLFFIVSCINLICACHIMLPSMCYSLHVNVCVQLRSDLENDLLDAQSQIEELKQFVSNQGKVSSYQWWRIFIDRLLSVIRVLMTRYLCVPVRAAAHLSVCVCVCVCNVLGYVLCGMFVVSCL